MNMRIHLSANSRIVSHASSSLLGELITQTEPPPLDSASPETVDAMCPNGTETVGAGFNTRGAGNVLADDLNPAPKLAETVAYEEDPYAKPWTLSTPAICA
jgi:hypothetical protein